MFDIFLQSLIIIFFSNSFFPQLTKQTQKWIITYLYVHFNLFWTGVLPNRWTLMLLMPHACLVNWFSVAKL